MVPDECVHLELNGIYNVARKLNIEAVQAVVGWEFSGGRNHPVFVFYCLQNLKVL